MRLEVGKYYITRSNKMAKITEYYIDAILKYGGIVYTGEGESHNTWDAVGHYFLPKENGKHEISAWDLVSEIELSKGGMEFKLIREVKLPKRKRITVAEATIYSAALQSVMQTHITTHNHVEIAHIVDDAIKMGEAVIAEIRRRKAL